MGEEKRGISNMKFIMIHNDKILSNRRTINLKYDVRSKTSIMYEYTSTHGEVVVWFY